MIYLEKLQVNEISLLLKSLNLIVIIPRFGEFVFFCTSGVLLGHILTIMYNRFTNTTGCRTTDDNKDSLNTSFESEKNNSDTEQDPCDKGDSFSPDKNIDKEVISNTPSGDMAQPSTSKGYRGSGRDKEPIALYDITPANGTKQDIEDRALERAIEYNRQAQYQQIRPKMPNPKLDERIRTAVLVPVEDDPADTYTDTEPPTEDILFKDEEVDQPGEKIDHDDEEEGEAGFISQIVPSSSPISDPNHWIINALKTIHNDIQQIKPIIAEIPVIKDKINEIQGVMGIITSGFIEMSNSVKNMELTISKNRMDIAKLTDLIKASVITKPTAKPIQQTPPAVRKIIIGVAEENINKMVLTLSSQKNLSGHQEEIIRNMLMIHDKDIIIETLKNLQAVRPIMSSELDKIVQMDAGSASSMQAVLKILISILPKFERVGTECTGPCTFTPLSTVTSIKPRKFKNPFKINQQ